MCEDVDEVDLRLGLVGFALTGDTEPTMESMTQLRERHAADVVRARSADRAFLRALSMAPGGPASVGVGSSEPTLGQDGVVEVEEDKDARMSDVEEDSDSLYGGSEAEDEGPASVEEPHSMSVREADAPPVTRPPAPDGQAPSLTPAGGEDKSQRKPGADPGGVVVQLSSSTASVPLPDISAAGCSVDHPPLGERLGAADGVQEEVSGIMDTSWLRRVQAASAVAVGPYQGQSYLTEEVSSEVELERRGL